MYFSETPAPFYPKSYARWQWHFEVCVVTSKMLSSEELSIYILHVCNVYYTVCAVCYICYAGVLLYYIPSTYLSMCSICASPGAINQSIITSRQMAPKISLMAPLHHCIRVFKNSFKMEQTHIKISFLFFSSMTSTYPNYCIRH